MNLAPNIYAAQLGDGYIILDLVRNRYTGLGRTLSATLEELLRFDGETTPPRLERAGASLLRSGFVGPSAPPEWDAARRRPPLRPEGTVWPSSENNQTKGSRLAALRALAEVQLSLRRRPFSATVTWLQKEKRRRRPAIATNLERLIDLYHDARPWFPVKPICRLDAFALALFLWRSGQDADLVFGVRVQPFAAHCWVQQGSQVVNEPHEGVYAYSPILQI